MRIVKVSELKEGGKFKFVERDGTASDNTYYRGKRAEQPWGDPCGVYYNTYLYDYAYADNQMDKDRVRDTFTGIMGADREVYEVKDSEFKELWIHIDKD